MNKIVSILQPWPHCSVWVEVEASKQHAAAAMLLQQHVAARSAFELTLEPHASLHVSQVTCLFSFIDKSAVQAWWVLDCVTYLLQAGVKTPNSRKGWILLPTIWGCSCKRPT